MKSKEAKIDTLLLVIVTGLIMIGTVMVYSSSSAIADATAKFSGHAFFLKRQVVWAILAFAVMLVTARVDVSSLRPVVGPALGVSMAFLVLVFFTSEIRGTHRWLSLGFMTFQPSELFKFVLVFYLAQSLSQRGRTLDDPRIYRWPYGPIVGASALLIAVEPDLGAVLVLGGTVIVLLFLAGARPKHLLYALGGSALAVFFMVFVIGYKRGRVLDYLASLSDPMLAPYQVKQAILSLACGGGVGVGLGDGIFKQFFLPEPHTDFIFASIGEEHGLLGLSVTLLLLFGVIWRGIRIATRQTDRFRFLLATGMTMCLAVNICINIAVVLGLIPTTGITLPFLSYGGSSLIMSAAAVGVLLSLSRTREEYVT